MRAFLLVTGAVLLFGCSTDTFVGPDGGGGDSGAGDVTSDTPQVLNDGAADADIPPIDPNSLGNELVLWLKGDHTNFDGGTGLLSDWPDQSPHNQNTSLKSGPPGACSPVGLMIHQNEINQLPAVSFCGAALEVADDATLQFGTDTPFLIASVIQPGSPATPDNYFFVSKSTSTTMASGFALLTPNLTGQVEGYLTLADPHVTAPVSGAGQYHIVTMVRRKALNNSALFVRIDGSPTNQTVKSEDVSQIGAPFVVGGFDNGNVGPIKVIPGKLAELIVIANPSGIPDTLPTSIDLYLKQRYGL